MIAARIPSRKSECSSARQVKRYSCDKADSMSVPLSYLRKISNVQAAAKGETRFKADCVVRANSFDAALTRFVISPSVPAENHVSISVECLASVASGAGRAVFPIA